MGNQDDPNPRIEALGQNILKDRGFYPDISDPSNPDGVSTFNIDKKIGQKFGSHRQLFKKY